MLFRQCTIAMILFLILIAFVHGQPPPTDKPNFAKWLLGTNVNLNVEYPGYDGWYNNLARPDSGAIDKPLLRRSPAAYEDGTYAPAGSNRPNPFDLSDQLLAGEIGTKSRTGKTAFLVFFGQQIVEEILDAQRPACPPEYFNIPIPENHTYRAQHTQMPLLRTRFDHRTGITPNNPRQQLNEITPYLDGGLVYGITKQWSDQLRTYSNGTIDPDGRLASSHGGLFPEYNDHRLPMANPPPPFHHAEFIKAHETKSVSRFFKLGNPRGNENTFLLTFGVLWFRWHNLLAENLRSLHPEWSSEMVFNEARKWVIGTQQHIVTNEWLKSWLSRGLPEYEGYDASIDPQIDQFFQAAAFRFGHTLVTPGVYVRDYNRNNCTYNMRNVLGTNAVRTCNAFWRPQDAITAKYNDKEVVNTDRLLMGMASQLCEEEDHKIVEDLRGNVFGPLEFPRRDLMAVNVQRGRDHGLPDFNSARRAYGLLPYTTFDNFTRISPDIRTKLKTLYKDDIENIDTWIGGILETVDGPGELFETIILDQFRRIRDADRFWYRNTNNRLFTNEEISRIERISVYDIVMATTNMDANDIQYNVFQAPPNDSEIGPACKMVFEKSLCTRMDVNNNPTSYPCYHLPVLNRVALNEDCVQGTTYDYFWKSEASYIITFTFVGTFIALVITIAYYLSFMVQTKPAPESENRAEDGTLMFIAKEIVGPGKSSRVVFLTMNKSTKNIEVTNVHGVLLRAFNCAHGINYLCVTDKPCLILKAYHGYDLVVVFEYERQRTNFVNNLKTFSVDISSAINEQEKIALYKLALKSVITKEDRNKQLESFTRVVYAQSLKQKNTNEEMSMDDKSEATILADVELTMNEFAEILRMEPESDFVQNMFKLVDKDHNNFISLREFLDFITVFFKGTSEDIAQLLFNMYDINATGKLNIETFKQLTKSFLGRSKTQIDELQWDKNVDALLREKKLNHKTELTYTDFRKIISEDINLLKNVNINIQIGNQKYTTANQMINEIYGDITEIRQRFGNVNLDLKDAVSNERTRTLLGKFSVVRFAEQYSKEIFWLTLYTLVLLAIFAERAYYYSVEREVGGLRQIAGYGVSITRGAASAMMFTYSSLLLTMCRNLITKLRETVANNYFPFDFCVDFHKYIASWALFFTLFHIIGHALNFYHISTQTADDLTCLFRNYFHATHEFPKFQYWCWSTITGVTGILLTLILAVMIVFAQSFVRRKLYKYFWYTHALYPIFFALMVLHGTGRLVQNPIFYYFFLGPAILFTIDQLISLSRKKIEIIVQGAKILASGVTMLIIQKPKNFTYKAGQWVRIACLELNSHEYHPFTLSSSPDEDFLSVHIRAVGPWTKTLRKLYENSLNSKNRKVLPKLYVDGPFGEGHQDWERYDVSILIAAGIGVTPFASILKDIVFRSKSNQLKDKKVYFMWIARSQNQFEWFMELLREIEKQDDQKIINSHLYITEIYEKYDLRTTMLYIFEKHYQKINNKSLFTNLEASTHFGRPKYSQFFKTVQSLHPNANKIGVFSCGNPQMNSQISSCCSDINKTRDDIILEHYFETF